MIKNLRKGKNNIKAKRAIILFFLFIFIIIFIIIAIHTSKVGIEIINLQINTQFSKEQKINKDSRIYVYLLLFNYFKLFKKEIREINFKNIKLQNKDIDIKFLKTKDFKINYKELLKNIKIEIKRINLSLKIGTENAALTAILVGMISSVLGIIIKRPKYEIIPIYTGENLINLKLDGIFTIYLMHYIYSLILNRKRRDENERTSNRKSYDNCYE